MNNQKTKLIIGSVVGVIVVGLITFTVLSLLFPKENNTNTVDTSNARSPQEIVAAFKTPGSVAELSNLYSEVSTPNEGMSTITYTKSGAYTLNITATDFTKFEQKDAQKIGNTPSVASAAESFLTSKGLSKIETPGSSDSTYTVYSGDQTVCQLLNLTKMNTRPASLTLACVTQATITKAYEQTDTLLALSKTKVKPTSIQNVTISEGNKTLTTLNAYGDQDNTKSLLFAAIGAEWEYIGERPLSAGTTEGNPNGIDRSLSKEIQAKINDPKYEGFLKKYVF